MMPKTEGVELKKIDETTYVPNKLGDSSLPFFCPWCKATFTYEEMVRVYIEHTKLVAEEKREKALKDAFDKEFAMEKSKFSRNGNILLTALVTFALGYLPLSHLFFGGLEGRNFIFWFCGIMLLGFVFSIYSSMFAIKREKLFEKFKARYIKED